MTQPEKAPPAKNAKKRKKDEKPARSDITALVRRGTRAYYHRVLPGAVGGDRLYRALEAAWSSDVAKKRAGALNTLYDRGDWNALRRWAAGDMHISVVQRVVLDGAWDELREIYVDDDLLGPAIADHMKRIAATQAEGTRSSHGTVTNALLEEFGPERAMSPITRDEAEAFLHKPRVKGKGGALKPWAPRTQRLARTIAGALWK
jgi:hypothetical protein